MAAGKDLRVNIIGDPSSFIKAANRVEKRSQTMGKRLGGAAKRIAKSGALAGAAMGAAAIAGMVKSTGHASDLEEALNKSNELFGTSAGVMEDWAKGAASNLGLSTEAALDGASGIGAMLRPMGFAADEAAAMSKQMAILASDMGSFNNEDPSEMLDRIRSGLSGESEPLKRFGSVLSAARVALFAVKNEMIDIDHESVNFKDAQLKLGSAIRKNIDVIEEFGEGSWEAQEAAVKLGRAEAKFQDELTGSNAKLDESTKIRARLGLLMEDTAIQQGDFARTSDGLANQQRILGAEFKNVSASIGAVFLPIATKAMAFLLDTAVPAIKKLADEFKTRFKAIMARLTEAGEGAESFATKARKVFNRVKSALKTAWSVMKPIFVAVGDVIRNTVIPIVLDLKDIFVESFQKIMEQLRPHGASFKRIFAGLATAIRAFGLVMKFLWDKFYKPYLSFMFTKAIPTAIGFTITAIDAVRDAIVFVKEKLPPVLESIKGAFVSAFGKESSIRKVLDGIIGVIEAITEKLSLIPDKLRAAGGFFSGIISKVPGVNLGSSNESPIQTGRYDSGGWLQPGLTLAHNATGRPERVLAPGQGAGGVNVYVSVTGSVVTEQDLVKSVRDGIISLQRRNGTSRIV